MTLFANFTAETGNGIWNLGKCILKNASSGTSHPCWPRRAGRADGNRSRASFMTARSYIYAAWTRLSESALLRSRTLHIFAGAICFGSRRVVMRPSVACGSVETLGGKPRRAMASKWRTVFQLLVYLVYLTLMSDGREVQGEWGVYRMARAAVDREARSSCHHSNTCIARTSVSLFTAYLCNLHLAEQRITVFPLHWTLTFQILGEARTAEMYVYPAGPQ